MNHDHHSAVKMAKGLTAADADGSFESRQQILEQLQVQALLAVEGDDKVAYACCILGEKVLCLVSGNTESHGRVEP